MTFTVSNGNRRAQDEFIGIRQLTPQEKLSWKERQQSLIQGGVSSPLDYNKQGELTPPPNIKLVPLYNRSWNVLHLNTAVPFADNNGLPINNHGLIEDVNNGEQVYLPTHKIKQLSGMYV